jgi:hypothetical protein
VREVYENKIIPHAIEGVPHFFGQHALFRKHPTLLSLQMKMYEHTDDVGNLYDNESAARNAMAAEESFIDGCLCRIDEPKLTLKARATRRKSIICGH